MKNGIDFLLIIVLLATIGLLIYFGMGDVRTVSTLISTSTNFTTDITNIALNSTSAASSTPSLIPTRTPTETLIPASVTIPTKTQTITPSPTETSTMTSTDTLTPTATLGTDSPVSQVGHEINSGIKRGNTIVKAIEAYQKANGKYPDTLNQLIPSYLSDIPMTSTGQAFFYRLFNPGNPLASEVYWVSFRAVDQNHVTCTYFRRLDFWDCNFASP